MRNEGNQFRAVQPGETARAARARRQPDQHGFTLIELLVVIVILGILSAVVIFAVRGAGDKGQKAANDTDLRILRTAQEAYCARFGKYAQNDRQLVDPSTDPAIADQNPGTKGFLSEESETHEVTAANDGTGPCNGWSYSIPTPNLGGPDEQPTCGQPGGWCPTESPMPFAANSGGMVSLLSGEVLGFKFDGTVLYNPALAKWREGAKPVVSGQTESFRAGHVQTLAARTEPDSVMLASDCQLGPVDNCGKVLVLLGGSGITTNPYASKWYFYSPPTAVEPGGSWEKVPNESNAQYQTFRTRIVRITGSDCAPNCGKVLIVGACGCDKTNRTTLPNAELFDPRTNTFELLPLHLAAALNGGMLPLQDGRVLVFKSAGVSTSATLFNPANGTFVEATPPGFNVTGVRVRPEDGTVLAVGTLPVPFTPYPSIGAPKASVYHPDLAGGTWTPVTSCSENEFQSCDILASLPDGSVLATRRLREPTCCNDSGGIFRFSPNAQNTNWARTGSTVDPGTPGAAVLIEGSACESSCNKVLAVGGKSTGPPDYNFIPLAEIYTP